MGASASIGENALTVEAIVDLFVKKNCESLLEVLRQHEVPSTDITLIENKYFRLQKYLQLSNEDKAKCLYDYIRYITSALGCSDATESARPSTPSNGPFGVTLQFLIHFTEKYRIPDDMITGDVVRNIIIPETQNTQLTYLEDKLAQKFPNYFVDLTHPPEKISLLENFYMKNFHARYFLSHPWNMPFMKLVDSVRKSLRIRYEKSVSYFGCLDESDMATGIEEVYGRVAFFWIDVFCKNQHKPSPAMEEFHTAMRVPGEVLVALWPSQRPISLTRIWCCFEIWTALQLKAKITLSDSDDGIHKAVLASISDDIEEELSKSDPERLDKLGLKVVAHHVGQVLSVDVSQATATMPEDIDLILGMIQSSIGVEEMNVQILEGIAQAVCHKDYIELYDPYPPCIDGDGLVTMIPTSHHSPCDGRNQCYSATFREHCYYKKVKDVQAGDFVYTPRGPAEVVLVTKDHVVNPRLCNIKGVLLTPEHPVYVDGVWVRPSTIQNANCVADVHIVYNFELDSGEAFEVNGLLCASLTQEVMVEGEDRDHVPTYKLYGNGWLSNPKRLKYVS